MSSGVLSVSGLWVSLVSLGVPVVSGAAGVSLKGFLSFLRAFEEIPNIALSLLRGP